MTKMKDVISGPESKIDPNNPFKSAKQRSYLWAKKPSLAKKWTNQYGSKIK